MEPSNQGRERGDRVEQEEGGRERGGTTGSRRVAALTMLKMRMNFTERLAEGSGVSSTADVTMRHMWTRMEGNGMQDMTYQNTAGGGGGRV